VPACAQKISGFGMLNNGKVKNEKVKNESACAKQKYCFAEKNQLNGNRGDRHSEVTLGSQYAL